MEFLPGAFEREWERRRAMLMHEMQLSQIEESDWEEPRRGGVARVGEEGLSGFGQARRRQGGSGSFINSASRPSVIRIPMLMPRL